MAGMKAERKGPLTVDDLWQAMSGLPGDAPVLIEGQDGKWGDIDREIVFASGCHDGRYGPAITLKIGGFAKPWPSE